MAPTVASPATGAVPSPIASDLGKAARSVGLGLPALPPLPGLSLRTGHHPPLLRLAADRCKWLYTATGLSLRAGRTLRKNAMKE